MNFRNKKLVMIVRIVLGLMFLGSGITGIMSGLHGMSGVPESMAGVSQALWNMGIFEMIKTTEIVSGLMFIFGFLPWLAAIFVAPICVGIIVFDLHVAPEYIASGLVVGILNVYLGYAYWDKYRTLFERK